jgi:diguanylate cyclase (GGDEF)-like protein
MAGLLGEDGAPLSLHALLAALTDPTVLLAPIHDTDGRLADFEFAAASTAFDEFLGVPHGSSLGMRLRAAQEDASTHWLFDQYVEVLRTGVPLTLDNVPRLAPHLGVVRHYDLRATRVGTCVSVTFRDVTSYVEATAQLEYRALHDPLTRLYNRVWILDMLENELRVSDRSHETVAVLFIDLDNFKVINDSLGHAAGDQVLCAVADRISATLRARDYAARLGGDEFLVVGNDMQGAVEAEALAARVTRVINDELEIDGHPLVVGASVGVALSRPESTAASMLRDADSALFRAKANGRAQWQFFDDTMHAAALNRLTTESELRHGLADRQFVPYYQPIVGLDPLRITGYEALVRWIHPERGVVPPGEFLLVAEETGLIIDLGAQMLDHVCRTLATRSDIRGTISVNKSPLQINRPGWRDRFMDAIKRHRADPRRLIIEVTESAVLSHIDNVADDLQKLRRLGVGLHIDDFGTGYSSISLLRDLPVTGIKLDKSFTDHLVDQKGARVVAAGLASLADGLDMVSIAEGIEEPEQAAILTELGWTHGQGYLFGRPAPDLATALPSG